MFDFFFKKRELLPLPYNREIHCHLVPGVDDGAKCLADSLDCLSQLQLFGVKKVIVTPHHTVPRFLNTPDNIQPLFDQLKQAVADDDRLDIELENYSFEYRIDEGFLSMLNAGKFGTPECKLRPLIGPYILLENGWEQAIPALDRLIARMREEGYYIILAHPERYLYYAGHHGSSYTHLQEMGVQFQCNLLSFSGHYGDVAKKMAYWLLEHGAVSFMGSDMHHLRHSERMEKFLRSKDYDAIYDDLCDCVNNDQL